MLCNGGWAQALDLMLAKRRLWVAILQPECDGILSYAMPFPVRQFATEESQGRLLQPGCPLGPPKLEYSDASLFDSLLDKFKCSPRRARPAGQVFTSGQSRCA